MTRLVNVLIPSVKDAREWLRKTELHLKEEGEEPLSSDCALGPVALGSAAVQVRLTWVV